MAIFKASKVVSSLPSPLEANTIYIVRVGTGFDFYVSDSTGSIAHKINDLPQVSSAEAKAGTETGLRSWSPEDVATAILSLAPLRGAFIGEVTICPVPKLPTNWLVCNGPMISVTNYGPLCDFLYCGNDANNTASWGYKTSDSTGNTRNISGGYLRLPDYRGKYFRLLGPASNFYQYLNSSFPAHAHSVGSNIIQVKMATGGTNMVTHLTTGGGGTHSINTGQQGVGSEVRPPSALAMPIIYAGP